MEMKIDVPPVISETETVDSKDEVMEPVEVREGAADGEMDMKAAVEAITEKGQSVELNIQNDKCCLTRDKYAPEYIRWEGSDHLAFDPQIVTTDKFRFNSDAMSCQLTEDVGAEKWHYFAATLFMRNGVHYWEVRVNHTAWGSTSFGVMHIPSVEACRSASQQTIPTLPPPSTSYLPNIYSLHQFHGYSAASSAKLLQTAEKYMFVNYRAIVHRSSERFYGEHILAGDLVGVLVDSDQGIISYFRNGKSMGVAFRYVPTNGCLIPIFGMKTKGDSLSIMPCRASVTGIPPSILLDTLGVSLYALRSLALRTQSFVLKHRFSRKQSSRRIHRTHSLQDSPRNSRKTNAQLPPHFIDYAYSEYCRWMRLERKKCTIRTGQKIVLDIRDTSMEGYGCSVGDEVFTHHGKAQVVGVYGGNLWLSRKGIAWHYPLWTNRSSRSSSSESKQMKYEPVSRERFEELIFDECWESEENNLCLMKLAHLIGQKCEVFNCSPDDVMTTLQTNEHLFNEYVSTVDFSISEKVLSRFGMLIGFQEILHHTLSLLSIETLMKDDILQSALKQFVFYETKHAFYEETLRKTATHVVYPEDEYEDPKRFPLLTLKRQVAYAARDANAFPDEHQRISATLFGQMYRGLRSTSSSCLRQEWSGLLDAGQLRAFRVTFAGEGADDYGGPYREVFSQLCAELESPVLPFLIPVPNSKSETGSNRECFMLNPKRKDDDLKYYRFFGQLIGIAIRSNVPLPLHLISSFWKFILGIPLDRSDLIGYDVQMMHGAETILNSTLDEFESFDLTWKTVNSGDEEIELVPGGKKISVSYEERYEYVERLIFARQTESNRQLSAVKSGLGAIIPLAALSVFTWRELEERVVGRLDVDVDVLMAHTVYEGVPPDSPHIQFFWNVMRRFTPEMRCRFLQFVGGRARLPSSVGEWSMPFKILPPPGAFRDPDSVSPLSQTCFFSISLPAYTSEEIMYRKLEYAILNCAEMDADRSAEYEVWG